MQIRRDIARVAQDDLEQDEDVGVRAHGILPNISLPCELKTLGCE